ncbi:uncharacterized protein LOC130645437 [Hydractinia symbiolongicarpus]|uniref:uncharacterized protein LOC130645437 n=1 Tax=Hydractinia symbiolongicarpus TaxID=13093 RepID=UPI00254CB67C|nr:uncharacterized protein LOC130645437 [Hydractinia symbiolongicarpus]
MQKVKDAIDRLNNALDGLSSSTTSTQNNPNQNIFQSPNSHPSPNLHPSPQHQRILQDFNKQFPALNAGGSRYRPQAKKPRLSNNFIKDTWTHKFCALSYKDTSVSPNTRELMELNQVGLGIEKVVFPSKTGTHAMLLEELTKAYPKLSSQSGGIELLRAESGGINRPLVLIPPRKDGYSISYLKNLDRLKKTVRR